MYICHSSNGLYAADTSVVRKLKCERTRWDLLTNSTPSVATSSSDGRPPNVNSGPSSSGPTLSVVVGAVEIPLRILVDALVDVDH
jgi:hypothetical protein